MSSIFYYVAEPGDEAITDWFREQSPSVVVTQYANGSSLFFPDMGVAERGRSDLNIDPTFSPTVSIVTPTYRRGILWTVGEVHFLTRRLRSTYPQLDALRRRLQRWLQQLGCAYNRTQDQADNDYYFECGILNLADSIYALPSAGQALTNGTYFVWADANDATIDRLCKKLRLRGMECDKL